MCEYKRVPFRTGVQWGVTLWRVVLLHIATAVFLLRGALDYLDLVYNALFLADGMEHSNFGADK
jgi:hypothetical protein